MNLYCIFIFVYLAIIKSSNSTEIETTRDGRFIAAPVSFPNEKCISDTTANSNEVGACFSKKDCCPMGGVNIGTCADGYGTCCKFTAQCTTMDETITVTRNQTTLLTPTNLPRTCIFAFPRQPGVCQIRLDFPQFNLNRPTNAGVCQDDAMTISNTITIDEMQICGMGVSAANHMYLDYGASNCPIHLTLKTLGMNTGMMNNLYGYQIRATQIKCDSAKRVPSDCLQYYTDQSGVVTSFNYATIMGQQLNSEDYKVCIEKRNPGDRIQWTLCNGTNFPTAPFNVSNNLCLVGDTSAGCDNQSIQETCNTDYIEIPGSDKLRYCSLNLPFPISVTTTNFWLRVHFDDTEPQTAPNPIPLMGVPCTNIGPQAFPDYILMDDMDGGCILHPKYPTADVKNSGFCLAYTVVPSSTPLGDVTRY